MISKSLTFSKIELYDKIEFPPINLYLSRHLNDAYNFLTALPFKKLNGAWYIKINDKNANEYRQTYLIDKMSILFTPKTKSFANDLIDENLVHVLSEETKWESSTEPILSLNGRTEILFGMCTPTKIRKETFQKGYVFLDFCKCKIDAEPKAWVCVKCKLLLRFLDEKNVICECGVQKTTDLVKKCFKCSPVQEEKKKILNILFIGQNEAGKSMLINRIYSCLNTSFDELSKAENVNCILLPQFQLQISECGKTIFKRVENVTKHFNNTMESIPLHQNIYCFNTEKYKCKVIETPELEDTSEAKKDEYNLELIRNVIIDIQELHAICFVMPSAISKRTKNFEANMNDLLLLFPKTALKNVYFFFTCEDPTLFGDTRNHWENFISTFKDANNADIPFSTDNVFCIDIEVFMCFIAKKQGREYQNGDLESLRNSGDRKKEDAIEKFFAKVENTVPIKSDDILMTYELEQIGTMLQKEKNPVLEKLIPHILTTISQISMTSKFNLAKKPTSEPMADSQKPELFRAIELCEKHVYDPNLKQRIRKLLIEYGPNQNREEYYEQENENSKAVDVNKNMQSESRKTYQSQWPNMDQLKDIAEKLGTEWKNGKILKGRMLNVFNVQTDANQKFENINKMNLRYNLELLIMEVNKELEISIINLLKECFISEKEFNLPGRKRREGVKIKKIKESIPEQLLTADNHKVFEFPSYVKDRNENINAVGIDLGTSRCSVAVNRKSGMVTIPLDFTGGRLLPSYVSYDEENPICGQVVVNRLRSYSEATVFDSKRIIGKTTVVVDKMWTFKVIHENNTPIIKLDTKRGEIQQTATEVAAIMLKYMKEKAEEFQGKKLFKVVITVPAAFTLSQEEATKEAARLAGWKDVFLLPEPVAASFAYFVDRPIPNNSNLLLFDLGGGTLDVCVFRIVHDQIQIVANNGDPKLGGRDFDNLLVDYFSNKLKMDYEIFDLGNRKYKLLSECERIKEILSLRNDEELDVEDMEPGKNGFIKISRQTFQDLSEDLLNKIENTILSALYKSDYKADQIDKVLLVGGGCRMPMIKQLLLKIFPVETTEHCCEEHPDEVVAIGAAYYAYNIFSNN